MLILSRLENKKIGKDFTPFLLKFTVVNKFYCCPMAAGEPAGNPFLVTKGNCYSVGTAKYFIFAKKICRIFYFE